MAKNVIMKQYNGSSYEEIYPKTLATDVISDPNTTGITGKTDVEGALTQLQTFSSSHEQSITTLSSNVSQINDSIQDIEYSVLHQTTRTPDKPAGTYWLSTTGTTAMDEYNTPRFFGPVIYGNGVYLSDLCCFSSSGTDHKRYTYSTDGINWQKGNFSIYYGLGGRCERKTCFGNGKFLSSVSGSSGTSLSYEYSTDGINWAASSIPCLESRSGILIDIQWCGDKFVALYYWTSDNYYYTGVITTSTDGISWGQYYSVSTQTDLRNQQYRRSIWYCNNNYIVVMKTSNSVKTIHYSQDGITWNSQGFPIHTEEVKGITFFKGKYYIQLASKILYGSDLSSLSSFTQLSHSGVYGLVSDDNYLISHYYYSGYEVISLSQDGTNWTDYTTTIPVVTTQAYIGSSLSMANNILFLTNNANPTYYNPGNYSYTTYNIDTTLYDKNWLEIGKVTNTSTKIQTGSYVGTGTCGSSNQNSITCDFSPKMVIITSASDPLYGGRNWINPQGRGISYFSGGTSASDWKYCYLTWNNNTLSWYSSDTYGYSYQLNTSGTTYYWIAFG